VDECRFRKFFPVFMKYVTGGYVSEEEAGDRLAQCINSPDTLKSGVYWSWNGGARTVGVYDPKQKTVVGAGGSGGELFENRPSAAVKDEKKGKLLWDYSMQAVESYM
jgi:protochlorophyllide reductase